MVTPQPPSPAEWVTVAGSVVKDAVNWRLVAIQDAGAERADNRKVLRRIARHGAVDSTRLSPPERMAPVRPHITPKVFDKDHGGSIRRQSCDLRQ